MMIDFRILELLASKICHDLISPVGAINNGIELIEDIGGSVVDDAMKLISSSSGQAAKKLRLFRMAYGRAGSDHGVTVKEIRSTGRDYLAQGKSSLNWADEHGFPEIAEIPGGLKTILNMLMFSEDVLSHGGSITVEPLAQTGVHGVLITVTGSHAQLSEAMQAALKLDVGVEDISPRTVHAYVLGLTAEHYGFSLTYQQISDEKLSLILQPAKKE